MKIYKLTFGYDQANWHKLNKTFEPELNLQYGWIAIVCENESVARELAFMKFGSHWAFIYTPEYDLTESRFPEGELYRIIQTIHI